ncbi:MAG: electron transfer flavoprotein subunit beta/FixA family protein [Christensenellales bacterium]|jgi:electron transfer flavoprotein beta subunit
MRLLVLFKIVRDLDAVSQREWREADAFDPDFSFIKKMVNVFDEAALETALHVADAARGRGQSVRLTALTVCGNEDISTFTSHLYALKFDEVAVIRSPEDFRFNPLYPARLIAEYVRREGSFDLIFAGSQCGVGDNRQTPLILSWMLDLPCVTQVTDVELEGNATVARSQIDGGARERRLTGPAVVAMGNATRAYLRLSTLREKMAAKAKRCTELTPEDFGSPPAEQEGVLFKGLIRPETGRACRMIEGQDDAQKARHLFDAVLREVLL